MLRWLFHLVFLFVGNSGGENDERFAQEAPLNNDTSGADHANGGNDGVQGHNAPLGQINGNPLLSSVAEETLMQQPEVESAKSEVAEEDEEEGEAADSKAIEEDEEEDEAADSEATEEDEEKEEIDEAANSAGNDCQNSQVEGAEDNLSIVQIISTEKVLRPSNDTGRVLMQFLALRSDGAEVKVDSEYLLEANPSLLAKYIIRSGRFRIG